MPRLRLVRVAFAYADALPLFSDLDLDLGPGWTAVAGPNGAGKTTLLRLMAGELHPITGRVILEPERARVVRSLQAPERPTDEVVEFATRWDGEASRMRARFGLNPEQLDRWSSLSPGEQQRWQVAAALALEPEVLLLDEPTNHLDADASRALLDALRTHRGIGIVVSHNRAFLDALVTRTLWVDGGVASYAGTYSDARAQMNAELERARHVRREQKKNVARVKREFQARQRRAEAASAQRSAKARMRNANDNDGRGALAKGKAEMGEAAHSKAVARMRARAERELSRLTAARVDEPLGGALFVGFEAPARARLLNAVLPELRVGERVLLEPTTVALDRESRVHLAGPNGAGKTTLLRALVDRWTLPPERLLLLPQELSAEERRDALARVRALSADERGRALQLVAALGVDPAHVLATEEPSPGEAKKLVLAEALARRVWCVMLDEPTNHLDVSSIERLESALAAYPGALILVTHDAQLAVRTTNERWSLRDGRLHRESAS